jgi:hypothetical protein
MYILNNIFLKIAENSFLIHSVDHLFLIRSKDIMRKENYRSISPRKIDAVILIKIFANILR